MISHVKTFFFYFSLLFSGFFLNYLGLPQEQDWYFDDVHQKDDSIIIMFQNSANQIIMVNILFILFHITNEYLHILLIEYVYYCLFSYFRLYKIKQETYKTWTVHQMKFCAWKCTKFGYNISLMYCFNELLTSCLLHWHKGNGHCPRTASWITSHSKQFRQFKVKSFKRLKTNLTGWSCHICNQILKSLVMGMSTASLQARWASASFASNQILDGVLGKMVQFMWNVKQQGVQVQCTFLVCHWNRQLVIDSHWSNALEQYYIKI